MLTLPGRPCWLFVSADLTFCPHPRWHWDQVRDEVQREFDQESESFTLEQIVELGMDQHVEKIGETSASATKELAIELVWQSPLLYPCFLSLEQSLCLSWSEGPSQLLLPLGTWYLIDLSPTGITEHCQDLGCDSAWHSALARIRPSPTQVDKAVGPKPWAGTRFGRWGWTMIWYVSIPRGTEEVFQALEDNQGGLCLPWKTALPGLWERCTSLGALPPSSWKWFRWCLQYKPVDVPRG